MVFNGSIPSWGGAGGGSSPSSLTTVMLCRSMVGRVVVTHQMRVRFLRQQPDNGESNMDLRAVREQLRLARQVLEVKGAPVEGTAAGHVIIALEELVRQLEASFGYTRKK